MLLMGGVEPNPGPTLDHANFHKFDMQSMLCTWVQQIVKLNLLVAVV